MYDDEKNVPKTFKLKQKNAEQARYEPNVNNKISNKYDKNKIPTQEYNPLTIIGKVATEKFDTTKAIAFRINGENTLFRSIVAVCEPESSHDGKYFGDMMDLMV